MALQQALGTDMATLARRLQDMGRGKDRVLAHITPEEAALLKARGGRGSINPATGLIEFDDSIEFSGQTGVTPPPPAPPINIPQQPSTLPIESSTITANAAPSTVTVPDFSTPPAPLTTPQVTAPAAAPVAPTANGAPESITVNAPPGPTIAPPVNIPAPAAAAPEESIGKKTKDFVSDNSTLLAILGLGGLGYFGAKNSAAAAGQGAALQQNLSNIAAPLTAAGTTALDTTLAGGLTPQNEQALNAARAQTSQSQAMGAVSSQQATEAISTTFANLLNTQLNQALTILNQADTYMQQAYLQGYQANVANENNTTTFYTNLASLAARLTGAGGTTINLNGTK